MTAPAGGGREAVVLLSGGLDSSTTLAIAVAEGFRCHSIAFDYGQRHRAELAAAERLSRALGAVEHRCVSLDLGGIGGSALTDESIAVPETPGEGIPVTYVPARNTIFLAIALGWAEVLGATDLFIGVNAVDYSGYPDCRPAFIRAFEGVAGLGTKLGVESGEEEGAGFRIHTPLMELSKAEIIRRGVSLGVDYGLSVSCYQADEQGRACGRCDACRFRLRGFEEAGVPDPTAYREESEPPETSGG